MQIPLYQIQNILKLYSRQLSLGSLLHTDNLFGKDMNLSTDPRRKASEGKRPVIMDKVVSNIVDRIITENPRGENRKERACSFQKNPGEPMGFSKGKNQFTYTLIDENNQRSFHTLPVEDSKFMVKRVIELARKVADY